MITMVTGKNKITLPADLVDELGIARGSRIEWIVGKKKGEGRFRELPSRPELTRRLLGAGRKCVRNGDDWVKDLCDEREREDTERAGAKT